MSAMRRALVLLFAFAGVASAQTPQESKESKDAPQKPRPPLNLSLDPADQSRSRITFEPRTEKKPAPEATLPGMGGDPTRRWEPPSDKVFPPDTAPNTR